MVKVNAPVVIKIKVHIIVKVVRIKMDMIVT